MKSAKWDVIVVGAGAAGLNCADRLLRAGLKVLVLEARDRVGGRVLSLHSKKFPTAIELGAEYIHGRPPVMMELARRSATPIVDVTDGHHVLQKGRLESDGHFFDEIEKLIKKIPRRLQPDMAVAQFMPRFKNSSPLRRDMFRSFVEGFHCADLEKLSAAALVRASSDEDASMFRIPEGYMDFVLRGVHARDLKAHLRLQTQVKKIRWSPGLVQVDVLSKGKAQVLSARQLVMTAPLGVLKNKKSIQWDPMPENLQLALDHLEMGHVQRLVFTFKERFWENLSEEGKLSFLHTSAEDYFPTWWTQLPLRTTNLTAWQGGPKALQMQKWSERKKISAAFKTLGRLTGRSQRYLNQQFLAIYTHNWSADPFSQGAYSYVKPGGLKAAERFRRSMDSTIYFAGEATATDESRATVHGAVGSGLRVAESILTS